MTTRTLRHLRTLLAATLLTLGLFAGPVAATESAPADAGTEAPAEGEPGHGEEQGDGKIQLPLDTERPRDAVGLAILGVSLVLVALAFENMRRQLRGERRQATGEWRYR